MRIYLYIFIECIPSISLGHHDNKYCCVYRWTDIIRGLGLDLAKVIRRMFAHND